MGRHDELLKRHRAVLPSWIALYYEEPISIVDGEGRHVVDAEGNRYLDMFGGILTTMSGYRIPEVVEAIREQAGRMLHTSTLYLIESQIELAERIAALSGIPDAKVFFTNSGTEANDAALMMSTQYRKSNQVLAMRNSYHGKSHSAVAVTGNRAWSATQLTPFHTVYVQSGYRYRSPFKDLDDAAYIEACKDDLRDLLRIAVSGQVACLIAEPIQGVGGFATPPDGFYGGLEEVLDEQGILFISDEVQTGWGRTGEHFWGYQAHDVTPDLITFAKGLGNGVAIAGVVGRADIIDAIPANSISTFGGNPLATTAALANLDYLIRNDLQTNARKVGGQLRMDLDRLAEEVPNIGDVRGKGLMLGVEFVVPATTDPDVSTTKQVMEAARRRGLLIGSGGLHGNVLRIAPPLSITSEEAADGFRMLSDAVHEVVD
ncbi:MAG TPA: aspartate aminotransferase family protein [Acidimicrobiia bacterium]|nr:aspartate aminotransferase family protein [Acidimicrobiia bacterium]